MSNMIEAVAPHKGKRKRVETNTEAATDVDSDN